MSKLLKTKLFYKKIVSPLQQGKEYVFFQLEKDCSKGHITDYTMMLSKVGRNLNKCECYNYMIRVRKF
jgi:hypothetical protein